MTEKVNNQLLRLAKGIYTCEGSIIVGTLNMQVMVMVTMNKVKVASDAAPPNTSASQDSSVNEPIEAELLLQELFEDQLLSDLPPNITIQEVDTLIALELGTAFEITIERNGLEDLVLIVRQNATVYDLKCMITSKIEREVNGDQQTHIETRSPKRKRVISWKYIWNSYCLMFQTQKLLNDRARIQEFGIKSGSVIKFTRYIREKRHLPAR
ncbi:1877_t:CDS:2 [Paraglomus brasilianum]|uniref:1877_t:CDS:1 n=1 Tax=Paraglomus brasilianum TaxID=144538 RepID=A0A9N9BVF0_9GLOM|nr:1877_t:CDS:2 [Paraglomus brasilianum]